jgi:hypothetical protein
MPEIRFIKNLIESAGVMLIESEKERKVDKRTVVKRGKGMFWSYLQLFDRSKG